MEYFAQAQHDGLCGLYAALNGFAHLSPEAGMQESFVSDVDRQDFFDCAIDSLARVPGVDIRVVKGSLGLDEFQIEELCRIIAIRRALPVSVDRQTFRRPKRFSERYSELVSYPQAFALLIPFLDNSHWVTIVRSDRSGFYTLVDNGPSVETRLGEGRRYSRTDAIILRHEATAPA